LKIKENNIENKNLFISNDNLVKCPTVSNLTGTFSLLNSVLLLAGVPRVGPLWRRWS
jgi:hypothetical protein